MRFLPVNDQALLVELDDLAQTMALYRQLMAYPVEGVLELVPAARTLLVFYQRGLTSPAVLQARLLQSWAQAGRAGLQAAAGRTVEIPVRYDGEDLAEVAERLGISPREVIARHTGQLWQAAFAGFAPGFVYLAGGHPCFQIPRRSTPRTRVPAGSVALGGAFSAVYPNVSPGGWQLIGTTPIAMWDLQRPEPAYVQPGFGVQFRDVAEAVALVSLPQQVRVAEKNQQNRPETVCGKAEKAIEIVSAGLQTLVQDAGRNGLSGLGVSPSGALDQTAMRQANRMVGNPVGTPVLENLLGGLQLRSRGHTTLAVAGASLELHGRTAEGQEWTSHSPATVALNDGDTLTLASPGAGVRAYVALRGGWQVAPVLGSCATDTLAHVGPAAVQAGDCLPVGGVEPAALQAVHLPEMREALPRPGQTVTLDVVLGPRTDWFTAEAVALLQAQSWQVTPQSNRIGMRLLGAQPLARSRHDELPSEGTVAGAIQVPVNGQPVLFLADHPLTGGYPVIGAVASHHLDLAGQIPVGCWLRFRVTAPFIEGASP